MSYRTGMTVFAIAALTLAPAVAGAQATTPDKSTHTAATTQQVDDSTLDTRIEKRIKADASLKKDDIDVSVDGGVVTLTGKVHSLAQKNRAERLAKVTGVSRVDNKLEIETAATTGVAEKGNMEKAGAATGKAMGTAGQKTKEAASATGEAVTDTWITTALAAKFVDEPTLKDSNINVDTKDHVVTLKGTVLSAAGRARAVAIAKDTKGVSRVIDTLTIGPKK